MSNPTRRNKKEHIVSVRLPKGLVQELKDLKSINHFMDISDEIRFIIRKYTQQTTAPTSTLDEKEKLAQEKKQKLIQELTRIITELESTGSDYEEKLSELSQLQKNTK